MNVTVIGTGYVGLVSGVCLATKGHHVRCVDIRDDVVRRINNCEPPIYEPQLPEMLNEVVNARRFSATSNLHEALAACDLALIAVGTPSEGGQIDLRNVRCVAGQIGEFLKRRKRYLSVVVKSTTIPGTTDTIVRKEIETTSGKCFPCFGLGMNPEFLREGSAIEDFMNPDRIVLGHDDHKTLERLEELYAPWSCDKLKVNSRTAEMIKYANNALLQRVPVMMVHSPNV